MFTKNKKKKNADVRWHYVGHGDGRRLLRCHRGRARVTHHDDAEHVLLLLLLPLAAICPAWKSYAMELPTAVAVAIMCIKNAFEVCTTITGESGEIFAKHRVRRARQIRVYARKR